MRIPSVSNSPRNLVVALVAAIAMLCQATSYGQDPARRFDAPATDQSAEPEEEPLEVRYAKAHLALAKLDLKRAQYWNQKIPNMFSSRTMAYLKKHVEVDDEQLRQHAETQRPDIHAIYVRGAKAAVELAEAEVVRKRKSYQEVGGTYPGLELDRAIAVASVAKLNLERTIAQRDSIDTIAHLQWQLEELRNQILELQVKVETTPDRR